MFKLRHNTLFILSGLLWLAVGLFLLPLGLNLLTHGIAASETVSTPLLDWLAPLVQGRESAALILVAVGLVIGQLKGRKVLGKTASKTIARLSQEPNPTGLGAVYTPKYCILIASMVLLGMGIKFFQVPNDIRGLVDVAIGTALIQGSLFFFKTVGRKEPREKAV